MGIGLAFRNLGQLELALKYYSLAEKNYGTQKSRPLMINMGVAFREKMDYPKALRYFEQAILLEKGEKKSLIEMVRKNSIEYLEKFSDMNKRKYEKSIGALEELKQILNLDNIPKRIESFDISNIQGVDSIGSMVVFTNGKKDKKEFAINGRCSLCYRFRTLPSL